MALSRGNRPAMTGLASAAGRDAEHVGPPGATVGTDGSRRHRKVTIGASRLHGPGGGSMACDESSQP